MPPLLGHSIFEKQSWALVRSKGLELASRGFCPASTAHQLGDLGKDD